MSKIRPFINIGLILTLTIVTGILVFTVATTEAPFVFRHYLGILFTIGTICAYFYNKNLFRLALFATLFIGNFCGLSSFLGISTYHSFFSIGSLDIPLYWGQPEYSIMLIIFIVFNSGFFIGIVTKEYWHDFLTRTNDLERVYTIVNVDKKIDQHDNKTNIQADQESET